MSWVEYHNNQYQILFLGRMLDLDRQSRRLLEFLKTALSCLLMKIMTVLNAIFCLFQPTTAGGVTEQVQINPLPNGMLKHNSSLQCNSYGMASCQDSLLGLYCFSFLLLRHVLCHHYCKLYLCKANVRFSKLQRSFQARKVIFRSLFYRLLIVFHTT